MNRTGPIAALAAALLVPLAPAGHAAAAPPCQWELDANGDGHADTVVGTPDDNVGNVQGAGSITIIPGGAASGSLNASGSMRITQEMIGQVSETGDAMGASFTVFDWNPGQDYCKDLAIGIPGQGGGRGIVVVVLGSPTGLDLSRRVVLRQGANGAADTAEAGDRFGSRVASGGLGATGSVDTLLVGVPGEDIGAATDAGALMAFRLNMSAPAPVFSKAGVLIRQGAGGIPDAAESGDRLGSVFSFGGPYNSQSLAIGIPSEDLGGTRNVGAVQLLDPDTQADAGFVTRGPAGRADDRFGAAVAFTASCEMPTSNSLVAGVPGRDVGGTRNAGAVVVIDEMHLGSATTLVQGASGVPGMSEAGDGFGAALAAPIRGELLVGAPLEDVGAMRDAGTVTKLHMTCGPGPSMSWSGHAFSQDSPRIGYAAAPGNQFGGGFSARWSEVLGDSPSSGFDSVMVMAPGNAVNGHAGAGLAYHFEYSDADTTLIPGPVLSADTPGIPGATFVGQRFASGSMGIQF